MVILDAMGGDFAPAETVAGALVAARDGVPVVLVGDLEKLSRELARHGPQPPNIALRHAPMVISMDQHPAEVVKHCPDLSINVAMQMLRAGEGQALVAMGHTGATLASALLILGRLKGVARPALLVDALFPNGRVVILDVGANANCKPQYLQQFAVMGTVYARRFAQVAEPRVGLLSIGEEPTKGNELTLEAHRLMAHTSSLDFRGNVEGRDVFRGVVDVIVTDGFTGNVVLKLIEGLGHTLGGWIRAELRRDLRGRLGGLLARPAFQRVRSHIDPDRHGATPLLGVRGFVLVGHGSARALAVGNALRRAHLSVQRQVVEGIASALADGKEG